MRERRVRLHANHITGLEDGWLGPDFWANRLQDWVTRNGQITCVATDPHRGVRTASVLTRSLNGGRFSLKVRMGPSSKAPVSPVPRRDRGAGTDYRRAALVGEASGQAGGLLCVYGSDGCVVFRDHTDDQTQCTYPEIVSTPSGPAPARALSEQVEFSLDARRAPGGTLTLTLKAVNATTKEVLSQAVLSGRTAASVAGGFALVSSGPSGTYWFRNLRSTGAGVQLNPERA